MTGFGIADVTLAGTATATVSAVTTTDDTTYKVEVSGDRAGTVVAAVPAGGAVDAAGNANAASTSTDNTVTYDAAAPTVVLSGGASGTTGVATHAVTAQFSEPVTGFAGADVLVANGTVGNFVALDADSYTFEVTAAAGGPVTVDVPAASAQDGAGTASVASNQLAWTYDATAPTVTIDQATGQADPTSNPVDPLQGRLQRAGHGLRHRRRDPLAAPPPRPSARSPPPTTPPTRSRSAATSDGTRDRGRRRGRRGRRGRQRQRRLHQHRQHGHLRHGRTQRHGQSEGRPGGSDERAADPVHGHLQ